MYALDFDLRGCFIWLVGGTPSHRNRSSVSAIAGRIVRQIIEQCHPDHIAILVDCVRGCVRIRVVGEQVNNLGIVRAAEDLGADKCRVVNRPYRPLVEETLSCWRWCERLDREILAFGQ